MRSLAVFVWMAIVVGVVHSTAANLESENDELEFIVFTLQIIGAIGATMIIGFIVGEVVNWLRRRDMRSHRPRKETGDG